MNQDQFVARRQGQWQELSATLDEMHRKGPRRMDLTRVERLGRLYRQAASDLAYARTYFPGSPASQYLNQLVARAHHLVYAEEPARLRALMHFFWVDVPQSVRAAWRPLLLAVVLIVLGGLVGFAAVLHDPNLAEAFLPDAIRQHTGTVKSGEVFTVEARPLIGTMIMLNNIRVGLLAFGLGLLLGLGTAVVLFQNGLIVGGLAARFFLTGSSYAFWSMIVPHGALELMAIFLCGAAGFVQGQAIVAPGENSRRDALAKGARLAVKLVLGSVPFFVIAALIEGFVTPMTSLSPAAKYFVGLGTGVAGLTYWLLPGRYPDPARAEGA